MKYEEVEEYIANIETKGIVPGLDSIINLCNVLGNPQKDLKFVHIAGTNGKGSTLAMISTVLACAGYKVGRYISPVIYEYRERFQVNGKMITKKKLCQGMEIVVAGCQELVEKGLPHPTAFELETALAFWYFKDQGCDIVVLETGMGGRLDATNLIDTTLVSVITSVAMDHMQFLGNTLESIASEKAGIIKANSHVVCMKQQSEVMEVVSKKAIEQNSELVFADVESIKNVKSDLGKQRFDYEGLKKIEISLVGKYQLSNAVVALETIKVLEKQGFSIPEKALRKGLAETIWDGRLTVLEKKPLFIADGAHNVDAAEKLAQSIEFYFTNRRIIYIMGMLKDKEYQKVIDITHKYADYIITITPPNNKRALDGLELASELTKVHGKVTAAASVEEAVEMSRLLAGKDDVIIAFGSLSYLGRLMNTVRDSKKVSKRK